MLGFEAQIRAHQQMGLTKKSVLKARSSHTERSETLSKSMICWTSSHCQQDPALKTLILILSFSPSIMGGAVPSRGQRQSLIFRFFKRVNERQFAKHQRPYTLPRWWGQVSTAMPLPGDTIPSLEHAEQSPCTDHP